MGKKSKQKTINPTGSFSIAGGPSANYKNGNTTLNLTQAQQDAYKFAQNSFAENLGSINTFSPEVYEQLKSQVNAYRNNALQELNDNYTPMIKNTQNDSAKRFGNFDNSVFLNNLNTLENNRAKAMAAISQNVAAKENELIREQLQDRYDYLNFLNSYQNQILNNALSIAAMATSAADLNGKYKNISQNANANNTSQMAAIMAQIGNIASKLI